MEQVQYINYKKQKLPVRLSYRVFKGLKVELGEVDLDKLNSLDPALLETMLWHGLVSGHKFEDKPLELKKEDMEDVLDHCMFEFIQLIPVFFPDAKMGNVLPDLGRKGESQAAPIEEKKI